MGPLVFGLEPAVANGLGLLGIGAATSVALKDADLSFPNEVRGACLFCHDNAESQTEVKKGTYDGPPPKDWSGAFSNEELANAAKNNVLHNEKSESNSEESPGRRKPDGKASELPVTKKGTKEWNDAVKDIKTGSKESKDYSVESEQDADDLLAEGRPEAAKEKKPTYTDEKYKTGHEHHPDESHTENASHNDMPHIKWKDGQRAKETQVVQKDIFFIPNLKIVYNHEY